MSARSASVSCFAETPAGVGIVFSGVGAQYESESVYHQVNEQLEKQGVLFMDMDTALREHEDLVREYIATLIPANDNKLAALNSAVWSGGSFLNALICATSSRVRPLGALNR